MAKSKEQIMRELDSLAVGYDSKQSYKELVELLEAKQVVKEEVPTQVPPERSKPIEVKEVRLGLSTIQDHEARITALEAARK